MLLCLFKVRCQAMNTLDDTASFDRDHLGELLFYPFGCSAAQVAFPTFGAHDHTRPGDAEAFRCRLMGFQFILRRSLLARHVNNSFSHKTPGQRYESMRLARLAPWIIALVIELAYSFSSWQVPRP